MLTLIPAIVSAMTLMQAPPAPPATGSSCMFQNGDKVITVLVATVSSDEGAQGLFNSKKRIVAGADVPGWGVPAYSGVMKPAAIVGVLKKQTFTEVKVIDATQTPEALAAKLQPVMKDVAARK